MRDPRVRSILGPTVPEEVEEEIAFHLAMRARDLVAQGMGEQEAREEALRRFGDPTTMRAECGRLGAERERDRRRRDLLEEARQLGRRDIRFEVLREGLATALVGLLAGAVVVIGAGQWVEPLLFGVTPRDPGVLAAVTLALALVALAAALVLALRAGRVEPLVALRRE